MSGSRFVGGAVVALLALSASLGAPGAHAVAPTVELDTPADGVVHTETNVRIAGRVRMPSGGTVHGQLQIALESRDGHPNQSIVLNVNGNPVPFSWDALARHNGAYTVKITAQGRDGAVDTTPNEPVVFTRDITVEVKPVPPANVRAEVDKTRAVSVRWDPNPEPDLVGYQVQRRHADGPDEDDDGQPDWTLAGNTTGTEFVDTSTTTAGGTYEYRVVALRNSATPGQGIPSDPSEVRSVKVNDPPGTTSTTRVSGDWGGSGRGTDGGGSGGGGGGSTGGGGGGGGSGPLLAQAGKVDLSGFSSLLADARRPAPRPGTRGEDDGTYDERLPFKPGEEEELGEDGTGLAIGYEEAGADEGRKPIAFVAASLLVTVILMHLLWLKREVDRVPEDALEPSDA